MYVHVEQRIGKMTVATRVGTSLLRDSPSHTTLSFEGIGAHEGGSYSDCMVLVTLTDPHDVTTKGEDIELPT